ncbi:MAG TPA: hypothetical protein H9764_09985 [Candidatus Flavonifractor merdavium]|nr:hypothetical protein [Candidatus Flavonifractor merdavium]
MKKMRIVALSAAVVLTLGITTAFAAGGRNYVDANGDGVCDNYGTGLGGGCHGGGCHGGRWGGGRGCGRW